MASANSKQLRENFVDESWLRVYNKRLREMAVKRTFQQKEHSTIDGSVEKRCTFPSKQMWNHDIKFYHQENSTTDGLWLVEYNKKLRESTVNRMFQWGYDRLVNYSYNSEMDEEEEYGFKKAYFYDNENFYERHDNKLSL